MKRRHVLALLGFFSFGGAAVAWRLLASFRRPDAREHIARSIAAIADVMFPGDGLASATALGLHHLVLAMPDLQAQIANGVAWLDKRAALDSAFASNDDGIQSFVLTLRYHLGTAYYSAPAIKSAFAYTGPPQPAGFADFQKRPV
jgi:hypothetical protein